MFKLKAMKSVFKSILNDLRYWSTIKRNNWHLHAPIGFAIGYFLAWLIVPIIFDLYAVTQVLFRVFVPCFLGHFCLWLFEAWQARGRIISREESFESTKDLIVGDIFLFLGVILYNLL